MSHHDPLKQFPPGLFDVSTAAGVTIFRVLSLSATVPTTTPPFTWKANHEHWFSPLGTVLTTTLGAGDLTVTYVSNLGSLQTIANALADPATYTFQLYALGVLSKPDWISGVPSWATPAYFFQSAATPKMQPLFEVSSTDSKVLTHISWFNPDNKLKNYFDGGSPGDKITCVATATSSIPTGGYYYRC